jgi:hypothetical protein
MTDPLGYVTNYTFANGAKGRPPKIHLSYYHAAIFDSGYPVMR